MAPEALSLTKETAAKKASIGSQYLTFLRLLCRQVVAALFSTIYPYDRENKGFHRSILRIYHATLVYVRSNNRV